MQARPTHTVSLPIRRKERQEPSPVETTFSLASLKKALHEPDFAAESPESIALARALEEQPSETKTFDLVAFEKTLQEWASETVPGTMHTQTSDPITGADDFTDCSCSSSSEMPDKVNDAKHPDVDYAITELSIKNVVKDFEQQAISSLPYQDTSSIHLDGVPESQELPKVRNIFTRVELNCRIDLKFVARQARNAEYHPPRFNAAVMRLRSPRSTAMIYASGILVTMGTNNETDALLASRKFVRILQKLGFNAQHKNFQVKNMVALVKTAPTIFLSKISAIHAKFATFEPEIFPGLVYRLLKPKLTIFVFANGTLLFTGIKSKDDMYEAFQMIYPVLEQFRNLDKKTLSENVYGLKNKFSNT